MLYLIAKGVKMGYGIKLEVWGDFALFCRPELKVERFSYEIMTPSAAKGILRSIYWHPGVTWVIDKIVVENPIQFTNIKRNEVKSKISARKVLSDMEKDKEMAIYTQNDIAQRSSTLLRDVKYVIEAHFILSNEISSKDSPEKVYNIALRRIKKGQCFSQPYLGCREFTAYFGVPPKEYHGFEHNTRNLGLVLYDLDYTNLENITPIFFNALLKDGILDLHNCEVFR